MNLNKHIWKKPQNLKRKKSFERAKVIELCVSKISANKVSQSVNKVDIPWEIQKDGDYEIVQREVMSVININIFLQVPLMSKSEVNKVGY